MDWYNIICIKKPSIEAGNLLLSPCTLVLQRLRTTFAWGKADSLRDSTFAHHPDLLEDGIVSLPCMDPCYCHAELDRH